MYKRQIYDHEVFKIVAFEKTREAGVELLLHTQVIDTNMENGILKSLTLFGKSYRMEVSARIFIDATGDGDVGYLAGAAYEMGQEGTGVLQPPTLMCTVAGVNTEETICFLEQHPEQMELAPEIETYPGYDGSYFRSNPDHHVLVGLRKLFLELKAEGKLPVDRDTLIYIDTLVPGAVSYTHLDVYKRQDLWKETGSLTVKKRGKSDESIHIHRDQMCIRARAKRNGPFYECLGGPVALVRFLDESLIFRAVLNV